MVIKLSPCSSEISKNIIKFRKQVTSLFQSLIEEVLPEKKYNREFNSKLAASLLTGMIDGLLLECSLMNKKIDSGKMTNQIIAVLF
jgi:hypothetical protein